NVAGDEADLLCHELGSEFSACFRIDIDETHACALIGKGAYEHSSNARCSTGNDDGNTCEAGIASGKGHRAKRKGLSGVFQVRAGGQGWNRDESPSRPWLAQRLERQSRP